MQYHFSLYIFIPFLQKLSRGLLSWTRSGTALLFNIWNFFFFFLTAYICLFLALSHGSSLWSASPCPTYSTPSVLSYDFYRKSSPSFLPKGVWGQDKSPTICVQPLQEGECSRRNPAKLDTCLGGASYPVLGHCVAVQHRDLGAWLRSVGVLPILHLALWTRFSCSFARGSLRSRGDPANTSWESWQGSQSGRSGSGGLCSPVFSQVHQSLKIHMLTNTNKTLN